MLEIQNLSKEYTSGLIRKQKIRAVDQVSFKWVRERFWEL